MSIHADPPPPVVYDATGLQYQTEKQLGRGGFAICWQAQQTNGDRTPSKTVALKIVRSKLEHEKLAKKFVTELQIHSKLHHPHIVEFLRAFAFESSTYVVLEICPNESLAHCLKKRSYLSMPEIRRYIIQICGAVKHLHMCNIVHRDLKTGNLFLDQEMNVKVGDFGLAALLVGPDDAAMRRTTMCGTPNYIAPEVLEKRDKGHNEKVDIWAIGIIAYTLAVGKAPFHASKPSEVLVKVAKGEYTWPDLGRHENDITDDLRYLVSQILVNENSRPGLDTIVSHDFFKMGNIPETLSSDATSHRPKWTIKPPNRAAIKRGYTDTWYKQCKASGVGEYAPGQFFSVAGHSSSKSLYRECEREVKAGKMPIVPMPLDAIYTPFVSTKGEGSTGGLENSQDRELSTNSSHLVESSINTKYNIPGRVEAPLNKQWGAERQGTVASIPSHARPPLFSYTKTAQCARRPAAFRSKTTLKVTSIPTAELGATRSEQCPIRPSRTQSSRTASRTVSRCVAQVEAGASEPVQSIRTGSHNTARVAEAGVSEAVQATRATSRTVSRAVARVATLPSLPEPAPEITKQLPTPVLPPSSSNVGASTSKKLAALEDSLMNLYTNPATILERAEELRNNVITALTFASNATSALRNWKSSPVHLPFVSNWVDYNKKYGIGYILADGSVGVVANHTDCKPLTHIVVDHGIEYLKTAEDNLSLKTIPFLYFTQAKDGSLEKTTMAEADRKQNSILWVKFGRYMRKHLSEQTLNRAREQKDPPITIVRYYQRVGSVSIWGFSNGCFQFNFPDHTKIVLSADGKYISFTTLPLAAITHMATHPTDLPTEYVKTRKVLSGTIYQLLYCSQPTLSLTSRSTSTAVEIEVVSLATANKLPAKLHFVAEVVANWVSGCGLGCKPEGSQWPEWMGSTFDYAWKNKTDHATVGRFGGDGTPGKGGEEYG